MQNHKRTRTLRTIAAALVAAVSGIGFYCAHAVTTLPDRFTVTEQAEFSLDGHPLLTIDPDRQQICLLGAVPVAAVEVRQTPRTMVTLCGTPFGLKMYADGALIVEIGEVDGDGGTCCPAKAAGLQVGDVIRAINGQKVTGNREAAALLSNAGGKKLRLTIERGGKEQEVILRPVYSRSSGTYKAGMWIKDSCAGIGTMTYVRADGTFAGLGHGITDPDTKALMPVEYGLIVPVTLSGVTKGARGAPGELRGYFSSDTAFGQIRRNGPTGIYGVLEGDTAGNEIEVAFRQEVCRGKAQILTTVAGDTPQWYDVQIERIRYDKSKPAQNMVIHITDPELLKVTGGIVQGMSGSPIVQDGRLVGAVTHVFVGDPTRGYGIFAENMLEATG